MLIFHVLSISVEGQGFLSFAEKTSFATESSVSSNIKDDWESDWDSGDRSFPIKLQLNYDIYSSSPRFIEITIATATIVSGLYIETHRYDVLYLTLDHENSIYPQKSFYAIQHILIH